MFKKAFLLSSLILFSISNISCAPHGDECAECMNDTAISACACIIFLCVFAAGNNKNIDISHPNGFVQPPKPQEMGDDGCNPGSN